VCAETIPHRIRLATEDVTVTLRASSVAVSLSRGIASRSRNHTGGGAGGRPPPRVRMGAVRPCGWAGGRVIPAAAPRSTPQSDSVRKAHSSRCVSDLTHRRAHNIHARGGLISPERRETRPTTCTRRAPAPQLTALLTDLTPLHSPRRRLIDRRRSEQRGDLRSRHSRLSRASFRHPRPGALRRSLPFTLQHAHENQWAREARE
jgi:hypothetical protein